MSNRCKQMFVFSTKKGAGLSTALIPFGVLGYNVVKILVLTSNKSKTSD